MYQRLLALKARILVVAVMFIASACVIGAADQGKTGSEPVAPVTPAAKAEPEKAETAVAATTPKAAEKKAAPAPAAKTAEKKAAPMPAAKPVVAKAAAPKPQPAATPAKLSRVARYVGVQNLNVRSRADTHAPIVGRLARGSMVTVSVDGTWARIGDGQFVAVKHLTKSLPQGKRLVSRK